MNIFKAFFCATLFQLFLTYFGQAQNTEYLYNQAGKKILYNTIDNVIHIGFEQGMSFANKNEVLENLSAKPSDKKAHGGFSGIGVANIKERLRLYYGDAGKVICESDGKTFTKISIVLPAEVIS